MAYVFSQDEVGYAETWVVPASNGTTVTFDFTSAIVTSPTPYAIWNSIFLYTLIPETMTSVASYPTSACAITTTYVYDFPLPNNTDSTTSKVEYWPEDYHLEEDYFGTSVTSVTTFTFLQTLPYAFPNEVLFVELPTAAVDYIVNDPSVRSEYPWITNCWTIGGQGEPTVHVPVNQLTSGTSTTMTIDGAFGGVSSSSSSSTSAADTSSPASQPTTASSSSAGTPTLVNPASSPSSIPAAQTEQGPASSDSTPVQSPSEALNSGSQATPSTSASGSSNVVPSAIRSLSLGASTGISGVTYSVLSSVSSVMVAGNGQTSTIGQVASATPFSLSAGSVTVVSGETYSALSFGSGVQVVANGQTTTIDVGGGIQPASSPILSGSALNGGGVVTSGVTVVPGTVTVIDGETISLVDSTEVVIASGSVTSTEGIGGAIMSGIGVTGNPPAAPSTGTAAELRGYGPGLSVAILLVSALCGLLIFI